MMTHDPNEPPVTEPAVLAEFPHSRPDAPVPPESEDVQETDRPDIEFSKLDPDALKVVHRLRSQGHQAYFVGGCVRDHLVGRKPKDYDIATSAHPNEVRN